MHDFGKTFYEHERPAFRSHAEALESKTHIQNPQRKFLTVRRT